jgi:glycosyltransferase involved in cell wall biosynthesis
MRTWIVTIGEPISTDEGSPRLLRHGILSLQLAQRGHKVVWWNSTFDHQRKKHRAPHDTTLEISANYKIHLIKALGYKRNVSFRRLWDHRVIARKFRRGIATEDRPDIILCSFPTIELSLASLQYGRNHDIPVVIDVRDMWPDVFYDVVPRSLRWLGHIAARPMVWQSQRVMKAADAIVSMSEACLQWGLTRANRLRGSHDRVFPLGYQKPQVSSEQLVAAESSLKRMGVEPEKVICWFIGGLGRRYDIGTIIEASRRLADPFGKQVQFVLSGDGDLAHQLRRQATGLDHVVFTGWIDTPQIAYLMSVADIGMACVNDVRPTLPNKLFEYFSAGLPVVSSLVGEAAELIERYRCGLNYRLQDSHSLATELSKLICDGDLRQTMGQNARQLYENRFEAGVVYAQMANHLEQLAAREAPFDAPTGDSAGIPHVR